MVDIDKTLIATIKKAYNNLRFLGLTNKPLFRAILEVCVMQEILDWADGMDFLDEYNKLLIKDKMVAILTKRCGFEILRDADSHYASANVPMPSNNDFWKLISQAPVKPLEFKTQQSTTPNLFWVPDPNYLAIVVEYKSKSGKESPDTDIIDMSTASIHDKMNIYHDLASGNLWYYGQDCQWHLYSGGSGTADEATIKAIINKYKINYNSDSGSKIETEFNDSGNLDNVVPVVSVNDIKNML